MPEDAKLKLELRLVPAEGEPNAVVFDDIIKLIRQANVTAPKDVPQVNTAGEFHKPQDNSQNELESKVKNRIEQASAASQADVQKRNETAALPDGEQKLADEALKAAHQVVSAVQRAIIRGIAIQVPASEK